MSQRRAHKRNLSKGILDMKFMKKSKEKVEREQQDLESQDLFANDITKALKSSKGSQFIIEHSMVPIETLLNGRMSFKGMNPEIERLMEQETRDLQEQEKARQRLESNKPEISDSEMAKHLGKTISKKFNSKRNGHGSDDSEESDEDAEPESSPPKRGKFLKPSDD
ncbi:M-phase phosphoprotein 6 [Frankliniella fusca]|uniref:M-phase phosphoprotein 6 n=1 Tax=Frankliniella fusca TaxID=407009 RepID=A0AAE1LC41_9NEOP|nr:M-phase phosphoprotein 6 [Frankliniella fusca]